MLKKSVQNGKPGVKVSAWFAGFPLSSFIEPILGYISEIAAKRQPGETITIVVPEFVSENRLSGALHTNTANILREQLKNQHGIVITNVPYHVHEEGVE